MHDSSTKEGDVWIFGYGSLIWRPSFPYVEARDGWVSGWVRRFWQGSTDHRGDVSFPGRVVTLIERPDARCVGRAFRIAQEDREHVLHELDIREQGGYLQKQLAVFPLETFERSDPPKEPFARALTYIALPSNPEYLGPAPVGDMASRIAQARGPSGPNAEYLFRLRDSLQALGVRDEHVETLAEVVETVQRVEPS